MCNYATEEQKEIACAGMFASLCYLSVKEIHEYYKKCKYNESKRDHIE